MADCTTEVDRTLPWVTDVSQLKQDVTHWNWSCNQVPTTRGGTYPELSWGGRCCLGYSNLLSQNWQCYEVSPNFRYDCRRQRGIKIRKYIFGKIISDGNERHYNYYKNAWYYFNAPPETWTYPEINEYYVEALKVIKKDCVSVECKKVIDEQTDFGVSASSTIGQYIYGTGLKSLLFVVYVVGTSMATVIAMFTVVATDPDGRFFGPMAYTHVKDKLSSEHIETHQEAEDVLL